MENSTNAPTTDSRDALVMKIQRSERKLLIVCRQLHFLREKERELTSRAIVAKSRNLRSLYYNLVLRRAVVEGTMNVLYEYVRDTADEIRNLRWEVYRQFIVIVTDSDSDMDDEDSAYIDELFLWWVAKTPTALLRANKYCRKKTLLMSLAIGERDLALQLSFDLASAVCNRHCLGGLPYLQHPHSARELPFKRNNKEKMYLNKKENRCPCLNDFIQQ